MKSSMLKQSSLCWKSDFIAEPSIPRLTIQNSILNNLEQLRWGRKEHHKHLKQSNPRGFPSGVQRAFESPPIQRCLTWIPWQEANSCCVFCAVLPMPVIIVEAGTLTRFLVSFIVSGLAFLIGATITAPSRCVSNKHRSQHLHRIYSKRGFLYIASFPEGEYHL